MAYKSPILTEVLAEFHLSNGSLPEKHLIQVASQLNIVGLDEQEFSQGVRVKRTGDGGQQQAELTPRIRCWNAARTHLAQLSPDAFYVNLIGEYLGWETFIEHVDSSLQALSKVVKGLPVERIHLVTIDKMSLPRDGFKIGTYLDCDGPIVPAWFKDVNATTDILIGQGTPELEGYNKRVNISIRSSETVDIQMTISLGQVLASAEIVPTLNLLHDEAVALFEKTITDQVRDQIMGGKR